MKYLIKGFIFLMGLLLFLNGCKGDDPGRQGDRRGGEREFQCPAANLSEEQKEQIKKIHQDSRASSRDISKEERQSSREELQKRILDTVPTTEEQKSALAECFERRRRNRN